MHEDKVHENRIRRMALRQRLHLRKSRRRDPRAFDFGLYQLIDVETGRVQAPAEGPGMSLDEVETYLLETPPRVGGAKAKWLGAESSDG